MELIFKEGDFLIKTLNTQEEMEASFRLRHEVFCDELKWVPSFPDDMERDDYDAFAHHLGLFNERRQLIGYVRLIISPDAFMSEKEFACLIAKDKPLEKRASMAESTRICVKTEWRAHKAGDLTMGHLLYKAIYLWCLAHDMRFLLTIIEKRYHRYLKIFFPFEQLGEFLPLGDGVLSGIVLLDWRNFEALTGEKKPEFLKWMLNATYPAPS